MKATPVRAIAVVASTAALAGCGSSSISGPQPADVAGIYAVCTLQFEPESDALPTVDIRGTAFEVENPEVDPPELRLNSTGELQLQYTPAGEFVEENIRGSFTVVGSEVRITWGTTGSTVNPSALLLPATVNLSYSESPRSLALDAGPLYNVPRTDYARLADISESGLAEQIPGRVVARFSAAGGTGPCD